MTRCFLFWLALLPLLWSAHAGAQPSETDRALSQSLFDQARQLMDAENYAEACPKLAESQRLDPGGGTLLNLALCYEKQGKVASAWAGFKEALSWAKRDGRKDRIQAAEEHIAALEPQLPRLIVTVQGSVNGQVLSLDGGPVGQAAWGTPMPLDPGTHEVTATAPGKKPYREKIAMALGENKAMNIPPLETDASGAPGIPAGAAAPTAATPSGAAPPQDAGSGSGGRNKILGWVLGGVGVGGLAVGTVYGVRAFKKRSESDDECPTDDTCSDEGVQLNNQAKTSAWISNIGFGVGILGVALGAYVLLSGNGSDEAGHDEARRTPSWSIDAALLPSGGAMSVRGAW